MSTRRVSPILMCALAILAFGSRVAGAQESASSTNGAGVAAAVASVPDSVVPRLIQFSGVVADAAGKPATGMVNVTFSLYQFQESGTPLWSETQNLALDPRGRFNAYLGAASPAGIPLDLFSTGAARWLGVQPELPGAAEQPRVLLVGVPYALKAADAETLGGKPPSAYVLSESQSAAGSSAAGNAQVEPHSSVKSAANASKHDSQPLIGGSGTTNFIPIWTSSSNLGNSNLFQSATKFVGVNTTTPQAQLESVTTSKWAIIGQANGTANNTAGVLGVGQSNTAANIGVQGITNSATGVGGDFQNMSASGGDIIHAEAAGGVRVLTVNSGAGSSGTPLLNIGAPYFFSTSDAIVGTGGAAYSTSGNGGVFYGGENGNYIPPGFGVVATGGESSDSLTPSGDGLYAQPGEDCCGGGSGLAAFFNGATNIAGNLSESSGSFQIDHPLDPANKYLYHSFVQSPDMMNIYNGVAVLDGHGEAVVRLPEWFEALNSDYRYQLTAIGAPAPNLHIAQEVANHQFSIAGGSAGLKVSWQITGIRQDAWAHAHRVPVEVNKPAVERGHYVHPELFGAPPEASILWARHPAQMRRIRQMQQKNTTLVKTAKPN
ncbi:MAG TPA: hypothetical protein VI455_20540 [Terriglobia bacterium]